MSYSQNMTQESQIEPNDISNAVNNMSLESVPDSELVRLETERWLEGMVIGLNLCPFARSEWENNRVRIQLSEAETEEELVEALVAELAYLLSHDKIETTLLVHPYVLGEFEDYNQFLDQVDYVLAELKLEGTIQVATFHPSYQFYETQLDAIDNFTNRSPYPMLHLLREDSLEAAVNRHPNPEGIPEANVKRLSEMGVEKVRSLLSGFLEDRDKPTSHFT